MKIVLVNWAKASEGASRGGGVNGYAQGLGLELVARGHEVSWLCGGWTYAPGALTSGPGACVVRRLDDWRGIRTFEVINSPVVAPGIFQFNDPLGELSAPELEAEVTRLFHLLEPDIVHFHNIEGFSSGCVDAARTPSATWPGAKVLFSLHNYHTICPQVYLMQGGRRPCFDFENGHACAGCVPVVQEPAEERRIRASQFGKGRDFMEPREPSPARAPGKGVLGALGLSWGATKEVVEVGLPGRAVATREDATARASGAEADMPVAAGSGSPEWAPLSNEPTAEPRNSRPMNSFGRRRRGMVEMLSRCDRVLAVSGFVRRKFEAMGVRPEVMRTVHIGTRMTEMAGAWPRLRFEPPAFEGACPRPVRLVFMGYNNYFKGLHMLCEALDLMPVRALSRLHLHIYAKDLGKSLEDVGRVEGRLGGLTVRGEYSPEQVPQIVSGKDLGVVPSVWWDNGPQTVLEFLACGLPVLGAELGGIPDWVKEGVNGMLFRGNDREHLAARLEEVAGNPGRLFELRRNVKSPASMSEHAAEMEAIYQECLADRA